MWQHSHFHTFHTSYVRGKKFGSRSICAFYTCIVKYCCDFVTKFKITFLFSLWLFIRCTFTPVGAMYLNFTDMVVCLIAFVFFLIYFLMWYVPLGISYQIFLMYFFLDFFCSGEDRYPLFPIFFPLAWMGNCYCGVQVS